MTGLDAPFFPESESIVVPGNDTLSVAVDFVPVDVTTYLDTIVIAGNVFGSTPVVSGEGTLPEVVFQETVTSKPCPSTASMNGNSKSSIRVWEPWSLGHRISFRIPLEWI